jgi:secondary thiamine-phosphate synthase enzyme
MEDRMPLARPDSRDLTFHTDLLRVRTEEHTQFIDLTAWIGRSLGRSGVDHGIAQIQVLHTTAAIVINENEPLLLDDFKSLLERLAPAGGPWAHDDLERRTCNLVPGERANGHAHARALLLGGAKLLNVHAGRLELGRWQSILLLELDGPRERSVSLTVMGARRNGA